MTILDFIRDTRIALQEIRDAARLIVASDGKPLQPSMQRRYELRISIQKRHIEELQNSLTKRNATIAELEKRIVELERYNRNLRNAHMIRESLGWPPRAESALPEDDHL